MEARSSDELLQPAPVTDLPALPSHTWKSRITKFRSSKRFILFTITLAIFTDALLYGLVVPVIPTALQSRVGLEPDQAQIWTSLLLGVYSGTVLVVAPVLGWLADNHSSRRGPLLIGLIALALTTGFLALADSLPLFVLARALQALSATIVWTVGLALVVDTVGKNQVGEAMGFITLGSMGGVAISPTLGGILYDRAGYYSVYYFALAFIAVDIVLRLLMIEQKDARRERYLASRWLIEERSSRSNASNHRHTETTPLLAGESTQALSPAPSPRTWKSWIPTPLRLLGVPRILTAMFCHMVSSGLLTSFDAVLPLHVKEGFGWNTAAQGILFFVIFFPTMFSPLIGRLSDRYGPRYFVTLSYVFGAPTLFGLSYATSDVPNSDKFLVALLFVVGCTVAMSETPTLAEFDAAIGALQAEQPDMFGEGGATAQVYSLSTCGFAAGATLFPVLAGVIRNAFGWAPVMNSLAGCLAVAAVPAYLWMGGWIGSAGFMKRKSSLPSSEESSDPEES